MPKTILITGASRGIGRAIALALAGPEARLILAARSAGALEEVAAAARAAGAQAEAYSADVADEAAVHSLVAAAGGPIDLLIHSVGGTIVAPFDQISLEDWEQLLRVQLTSLFLMVKHTTPQMGRGGLIINIASVAARQAFPGWSAYTAAKHGALGFLNAVREELRPRGVRVASILPAATDTEIWDAVPGDLNRANMLRAEDVAAAVAAIVAMPPHATIEDLTIGHVAGRL